MKRKLFELLARKGTHVHTTRPDASLAELLDALCEEHIGALPVMDQGEILGIVTERDVLVALRRRLDLDATKAMQIMTADVLTAAEHEDLGTAMHRMTEGRVRHLPILRRGRLVGLVSIGDIVNALRVESEAEVRDLSAYVRGEYY